MERDALIGHGTSYLLLDRLLNCSDYTHSSICRDCGGLLSTQVSVARVGGGESMRCRRCATRIDGRNGGHRSNLLENGDVWEDGSGKRFIGGGNTATVAIPFVLKYLDSELAAMGISMKYNVEPK
ncbi:hypothetical protein JL09_g5294 [Pichia kudriavzevii]|uniref:DNA-directed RNA polymerase n=1 Tax=Pichia kudriavzevii TaxID=4909 RepID=A0A099NUI6_PICKU|nr:hypothetical protein JL09_g5294 [Pichia kudriavzevii]